MNLFSFWSSPKGNLHDSDPHGKMWNKVKRDPVLKSMYLSGYIIDNGLTKCYTCGEYCGQCGDDRSGLTREEYERKYNV